MEQHTPPHHPPTQAPQQLAPSLGKGAQVRGATLDSTPNVTLWTEPTFPGYMWRLCRYQKANPQVTLLPGALLLQTGKIRQHLQAENDDLARMTRSLHHCRQKG